ncbi:MAG TPA: cardiolipin synthase [Bacilli bacterium]|nr:cardiolipin synthase [Bacilli bacterium]
MTFLIITLALIFLFIIWFRIDFLLGKSKQKRLVKKIVLQPRMSNVSLFSNGKDFFDQLFVDIKEAEHHIHLLWYIYNEDSISEQLTNLLVKKAQEGVEIRLLVDWFGAKISKKSISKLRDAGVSFSYSNVPHFPFLFFTLNNRNHRKITIIDGNIGYIGGFNIGDEYLGRDKNLGFWRDFHLRINGDGVQDLQTQFIYDWQLATNTQIHKKRYFPPLKEGNILLKFSPNNGAFLEEMFIQLIEMAKKSIMIGTPYYIPGKKIQNALIQASKRGIKVKLIVPKKSDYILIKEAAYPYFKDLLHVGIEIFEYTNGFYHAKAIVIDEFVCDIGTANFDMRSFHLNNEMNCLIYDHSFILHVIREMQYDIMHSEQLTIEQYERRPFMHKAKEQFAKLFSELL